MRARSIPLLAAASLVSLAGTAQAQLIDRTLAPNPANEGIAKSYVEEIGAGVGDIFTPGSSSFIIARDPFRAVRRGRQLFQRRFTAAQGLGPITSDGAGEIAKNLALGAGLSNSCAGCHGRPRGSAGVGGDVVTRPDSRDAPHLFGLGLKEMLADEITADLRALRAQAIASARAAGRAARVNLVSKGISYGTLGAQPDGSVDSSQVRGVDADLRVRPFFAHGGTISIREFVVGALNDEMGMQAVDPELAAASRGARVTTRSGMVLDGSKDKIQAPHADDPAADPDGDGVVHEVPASIVDFFEFYLLNYFKAGHDEPSTWSDPGRGFMLLAGCTSCHIQDLSIRKDRRVADVETVYDPVRGNFNRLFATATALFTNQDDGRGLPPLKAPQGGSFVVRDIFTDFKRHDLGPDFHERNYDGTLRTQFLTTPLWGVGSTGPYGHDGRSTSLKAVIRRHGGEATRSRQAFESLPAFAQDAIIAFLNTLILFPPDDTASTLDPGNRQAAGFPQFGHGSIKLGVLFNDPRDPE